MNIVDATNTIAQAKVMFEAAQVGDEEIEKLAGEFSRLFVARHPGVSGVAKALIQRAGSRRWEVLGKIELGPDS